MPSALPPDDTCIVAQFPGITHEEAEEIGQDVCVVGHGREVRAEKVGARYVITWKLDGAPRQVSVISLAELPSAITPTFAPDPPRAPYVAPRKVHFLGSLIFPAAPRLGVNWGIGLGLLVGDETWQYLGELRFAGNAIQFLPTLGEPIAPLDDESGGHGLFYTSLSAGVRRAFPGDEPGLVPFVGAGLAIDAIGQFHPAESGSGQASSDQSGVAGLVETGLTFGSSKKVAGELGLRVDLPTFAVDHNGTPVYAPVITAALAVKL